MELHCSHLVASPVVFNPVEALALLEITCLMDFVKVVLIIVITVIIRLVGNVRLDMFG